MPSSDVLSRYPAIVTTLISEIVTIPFLKRPFQDLADPSVYGLRNATNLRIPVSGSNDQTLGAWYLKPLEEGEAKVLVSVFSLLIDNIQIIWT